MIFTFGTEDGIEQLDYNDFVRRPEEFRARFRDKKRFNVNLGLRMFSYPKTYLRDHPHLRSQMGELEHARSENPLQFYLPCCARSKTMRSTAHLFLNNVDTQLTGLVAGNRFGKTTIGWVKMLTTLRAIPCQKDWSIFSEHGVDFYEWDGPKQIAVVTYEVVGHENTIWPQVVQEWTPRGELGPYSRGGSRQPNWKGNPHIQLTCGTMIYFLYCSQSQAPFESQALDDILWDEQGERVKFVGANERLATRDGRHVFSLTGHKVDGRPDTGAGSWIHKLETREDAFGLTSKFYHASLLDDSPDWIYPEKIKAQKRQQWIVIPEKRKDLKVIREGRARLLGQWHVSGGLVYNDWDRDYHVIEPFDIPKHWTRYRSIDHGRTNPTACLWAAASPKGDLYLYDEYVGVDRDISENINAIIEQSGNELRMMGQERHSGIIYERHVEVSKSNSFFATALDSRSGGSRVPVGELTLLDLYAIFGLRCVPASGRRLEVTIPLVKEWLRIDHNREHPITKKLGSPRCFVFSTMDMFIGHIERYTDEDPKIGSSKSERPKAVDDHDLDAFRYMIQMPPVYVKGFVGHGLDDEGELIDAESLRRRSRSQYARDRYTGY